MLIDDLSIRPSPDFGRFRKVLLREGEPDRMPFYELFFDKPIKDRILGKPCLFPMLLPMGNLGPMIENEIELWYRLGFDYVEMSPAFILGGYFKPVNDTADLSHGLRFWLDEAKGSGIGNRADFEKYPWLNPELIDLGPMEEFIGKLRDGMAFVPQCGGVTENATWAMGYESMATNLVEDPDLVAMVFDKVGAAVLRMVERMIALPNVGAFAMGDDMGHKTATLLSPKLLRKLAFPWHKKIADVCHKKGIPFILHSCGKIDAVMDDLIELGIDAKHSFEDQILPVTEAKKRWGDRIAVLGGVDMDILSRGTPDDVRARTREVLRQCMPGGGYALGSGNSVANYIKPENYLAMLEVGWREGRY